MSCQQASRFIINSNNNNSSSKSLNHNHNSNNCKILNNKSLEQSNIIKGSHRTSYPRGSSSVVQQEDPYVFTESVPTTPPILFNTQKTRTRLNDLTSASTATTTATATLSIGKLQPLQQKLPLTETNGKITSTTLKTQASFFKSSSNSSPSLTTTAANTTCTSTPTSKYNSVTQSLTTSTTASTICNSKKLTNVCIVRPQLQQQQPQTYYHQHQHHPHHQNYVNSLAPEYEEDLKSISPPPLYTPPTPSLWQTPLILESSTAPTHGSQLGSNVALSALKVSAATTSQTSPSSIIMGCVTPTVHTAGSNTTSLNPPLTTTAMAKVAPIIIHSPITPQPPSPSLAAGAQCLPPSKFHNHTLAQHLQKVECLKKSKKTTEAEITSPIKSSSHSTAASIKTIENASSPVKHSETEDLNEIPVNVIFRMAIQPAPPLPASPVQGSEKSSNNIQFVKTQTEIDIKPPTSLAPPPSAVYVKKNVNKKLSIPASKTIATKQQQQQINTSSIQQPKLNATKMKTLTVTALNSQTPNDNNEETKIPPTNTDGSSSVLTALRAKNLTHISHKTRKLPTYLASTILNHSVPQQWQMGCSTTKGAVAIVKMSQHHVDMDTAYLATASGLPYCLQQYWLSSSFDFRKLNQKTLKRSLGREERIAVYKQQLCRQAMQLLSTRSLQKLPLKVAKRRLICVDRLLRKYQQSEQNKKELPANVKRCCVNGCDAYTLEMASHCQQHIVYNSAQHVFLPCTAKFADNTQCRVPVFDITHDLPLCIEHARKRDAYNRLLYEQRPRKISTNPLVINESILATAKVANTNTTVASNAGGGGGSVGDGVGVIIKTQIYPQKPQQPQKQHILQQLPANNRTNINKQQQRATLVNQSARKRKMNTVSTTGNPVGRPQKRVRKTVEQKSATTTAMTKANQQQQHQMSCLTTSSLKRKSSTTSLESLASNSQHSTTSSTSQHQQQLQQHHQHLYGVTSSKGNTISNTSSLPPPALAPLSGLLGHGLPQHLFSFGHDNQTQHNHSQQQQQHHHHQQPQFHSNTFNTNDKQHSFSTTVTSTNAPPVTASTPTELKDIISQFSFVTQSLNRCQADISAADINLLNTNSNSNFTSSGMGSTTSLPTADDFLTQDMLSICENSSASSADTGLGGLSDPELMLGGPEDDIPLGDTHLLEEHDLENVLNSLPEDAFKELFTTVHQDESDEIERAIELADKHLKTLQQTIGSELGDFLDFNDDILMDNGDLCNGTTANSILDTTALFIGAAGVNTVGSTTAMVTANATGGGVGVGGSVIGSDIRGLVQT